MSQLMYVNKYVYINANVRLLKNCRPAGLHPGQCVLLSRRRHEVSPSQTQDTLRLNLHSSMYRGKHAKVSNVIDKH